MQAITPDQAFAEGMDDVWLLAAGRVRALLLDDLQPPRHQRFILDLPSGLTLLIAHNVERAERAHIEVGDAARVRGRYKWNEHGGLIHWTHYEAHMPGGGGWIELPARRANYS